MYRFASESSSRRRDGDERFGLVWFGGGSRDTSDGGGRGGAQKRDRDRRMARCDWARGISSPLGAGGGGDKQRAVAVGDLRVALPEAKQGPDISLSLSFLVRGRGSGGRKAGRYKHHPARQIIRRLLIFQVFRVMDHRPLHGLITRFSPLAIIQSSKAPEMFVRI
jgi:hypothetical protein